MKTKTSTLTQPLTSTLTTHVRACAAIAGLLIAGASAPAQVAPSAPSAPAANYGTGNESSIHMPKERVNLFLHTGFQYMRAGNSYRRNFFGVNVAFGLRLNDWHKIQVEISGLGSASDYGGGNTLTWGMGTQLFTYSLCIPFGESRRVELRLSPSLGTSFSYVREEWDLYYSSGWRTDGCYGLAAGAGAGLTIHVSKRIFLDAGYRYLRISGPKLWGVTYDDMDTHSLNLSCGWKF